MLTRRDFLRGLIASVASAALVKNGIAQPEQAIGEPQRTVFDMAANTWREQLDTYHVHFTQVEDVFRFRSPVFPPQHVNCRCVLPEIDDLGGYVIPRSLVPVVRQFLEEGGVWVGHSIVVPLEDTTLEEVARLRGVNMPDYSNNPFPKLDNFGISCDAVAKRIQAFCQAVLEDDARRTIDGIPS